MSKHKKIKRSVKQEPKRKVDVYFDQLDQTFSNPGNWITYMIFVYLFFFGILGMIWMIPFPQFDFLIRMEMHTFLNWASLFIAIVVYSYLKLAPTLSYAVLLMIGVMSFFIVQLEYIERDGGPSVWLICLLLSVIALIGLKLITNREKQTVLFKDLGQLITIGPIWVWSKVFDKLKWKY